MDKVGRNRLCNVHNSSQGSALRVLTVCSAGLLRSPTAAHVLSSEPFNFNTRSCGTSVEYALIKLDVALALWAQVIICMNSDHEKAVVDCLDELREEYQIQHEPTLYTLNIRDDYDYRDKDLVSALKSRFLDIFADNIFLGVK